MPGRPTSLRVRPEELCGVVVGTPMRVSHMGRGAPPPPPCHSAATVLAAATTRWAASAPHTRRWLCLVVCVCALPLGRGRGRHTSLGRRPQRTPGEPRAGATRGVQRCNWRTHYPTHAGSTPASLKHSARVPCVCSPSNRWIPVHNACNSSNSCILFST